MKEIICKALKRIIRIITFRKGVYCALGKKNKICAGTFLHEYTQLGNYNYIGNGVMSFHSKIGNYNSIAAGVKIGQMEHDMACVSTSTHIFGPKNGITEFDGITKEAVIENDVWLGANVVVKQGVTVHTGAVVGAGAVVTKDIPPYAVAVGVPARVIRYRFDEESVKTLLESKWWLFDEEEAKKACLELQKKIKKN